MRHKAVSADAFAFDSLVGSDLLFPGYSTLQNGEFLVILTEKDGGLMGGSPWLTIQNSGTMGYHVEYGK